MQNFVSFHTTVDSLIIVIYPDSCQVGGLGRAPHCFRDSTQSPAQPGMWVMASLPESLWDEAFSQVLSQFEISELLAEQKKAIQEFLNGFLKH